MVSVFFSPFYPHAPTPPSSSLREQCSRPQALEEARRRDAHALEVLVGRDLALGHDGRDGGDDGLGEDGGAHRVGQVLGQRAGGALARDLVF